jgi:flagellum-specific ATP synthase
MIDFNKIEHFMNAKVNFTVYGEIHTITDHLLISKGPVCKIGDICLVGSEKTPFEVIGLKGYDVQMMPLTSTGSIGIKDRVYLKKSRILLPQIESLLGRVMNGMGEFIDMGNSNPYDAKEEIDTKKAPINAMLRKRITDVLPTGIKAIDGPLTVGEGQRIGIFAGTGVGKSTLLGMIAKNAEADVNVIALVGERGREVKEFIEENLGIEGLKKSVVIVSTSDESKLMNIKAAELATSVAEKFRDKGKKVLLMMDSVTRFAMARREIDLATGQLAPGGKTPTMESSMQRLLERAGMGERGSITGIYTVLVEGDDMQGTIPDMARGILDGHIVLDRKIADMNHFPAINVLASKSRVMDFIVSAEHLESARELGKYLSLYKENEDAFTFGIYERGRDKEIDFAKLIYPHIQKYLKQEKNETFDLSETIDTLREMFK